MEKTESSCSILRSLNLDDIEEVVKKVGIPHMRFGEDWALRRRIWAAGYKWIVEADLKYAHLLTDWEGLRNRVGFNSHVRISKVELITVLLGSPLSLLSTRYSSFGGKMYHMPGNLGRFFRSYERYD